MPNVSNEFVAHAKCLAEFAKEQTEKQAAVNKNLSATAEMTVDTLIQQGLVPAHEKAAAIASLLDHEQALQALNKTAQVKYAASQKATVAVPSMGEPATQEKRASVDHRGDTLRESDIALLTKLGLR